ncbi:a224b17d-638c-43d7-8bf8-bc86673d8751 [Sclerotinia trifoliorum]|uniref:A224b17d-638c-43d7-8bf8-bc86673d8751 n=1 Tax=Sclerotinia trifoliorum TaxID=28548 RepID=A0A8H2ZV69_9HELO|nr:a224b17d-638c-43d7-8bf8-bc86673d8751 [Sclerotinia trifoliorum]
MMHPTLVPAAIAFAVIFLLRFIHTVMCGLFPKECTCKKNHILIRDLSKATAILRFSTLQSRAPPNQRLVSVFFISNAFTTTDKVVYNSSVAEAKDLLKTSNDDSLGLADDTLRLAREISLPASSTEPIHLNSLIQLVCFRFVLLKFFPSTTVVPCSNSSILRITGLINALWISSKCSCSSGRSHVSMQDSLQHEIDSLFPRLEKENKNPLNIILPAYETLWRVVLRCFLEVSFLSPSEVTTQWKKIIHEFLRNISQENFSERKGRCSAQDIVFESLRLYPPTKRIYRQNQRDGWIAAIDIEYLQRTEEIWGTDGSEFRPERWSELESSGDKAYKEAWMPFGKVSFQCPASKVAPMMIAMLVGCLVETFGNGQWILEDIWRDNEILRGQSLDNGREAFGSVFLRRAEVS